MKIINKQQAATLYGNNYKLQDKEGRIITLTAVGDLCFQYYDAEKYESDFIFFELIGVDYFILARPLDQLTQTITHEGEEISPIQELYNDGYYLGNDYDFSDLSNASYSLVLKLLEWKLQCIEGIPSEYYVNLKNE